MLTTEAGKNDTTARFVLVALAEKARGEPAHAFPSITTLRAVTGLDREVIRRALQRLAAGGLITEVGRRGEGVVDWRLNTHLARPDSDMEAIESEVDLRRERDRRRKRDARSKVDASTVLSGDNADVSRLNTAESAVLSLDSTVLRRDSTTQDSREPVRTGDEPIKDDPVPPEAANADASPEAEPVVIDAEIVDDDDGATGLFDAPTPNTNGAKRTTSKRTGRGKRKLNAPLVTRHNFPEPGRHVEPGEAIQLIMGLWVDTYRARGVDPAGNTRGQAAAEIAALIDVGNNPNLVAAAAKRAAQAGYATVIREVERMVNDGQPSGRRGSDPLAAFAPGDQIQIRTEFLKSRGPNWDRLAVYGIRPDNAHLFGFTQAS